MAITVTGTPGLVGYGTFIGVSWSGPTPLDDVVYLFSSNNAATGAIVTHGSSSGFIMLGFNEDLDRILPGAAIRPDGDSFSLQAVHYDAAGGVIETSSSVSGWTWDRQGQWPALINLVYQRVGGSDLADILAAVRRTF